MNMQKLTKKSIEAIQSAQDTAMNYGNTNVDQPHLLYALLTQENGLIPQLVKKLGKDPSVVSGSVERIIGKIPKVSGSGRDMNSHLTDCLMPPKLLQRIWETSMFLLNI